MINETEPSLPLDIPEQPGAVAGQKIGYARVSSKDQNLDRQLAALKKETLPHLHRHGQRFVHPAPRLRWGA